MTKVIVWDRIERDKLMLWGTGQNQSLAVCALRLQNAYDQIDELKEDHMTGEELKRINDLVEKLQRENAELKERENSIKTLAEIEGARMALRYELESEFTPFGKDDYRAYAEEILDKMRKVVQI